MLELLFLMGIRIFGSFYFDCAVSSLKLFTVVVGSCAL